MVAPPPIQLANLGMADSLILMVLALVVFGPRRLPQIGRQIGKLMYEFRKASNDFKFQMEEELRVAEESDRRKKEEAERLQRAAALPAPTETIEAQADIGAIEQASVSAQPASSSSESTYPEEYPPETPAPVQSEHSSVTLPRTTPVIQPPSTGEQVAAARPNRPSAEPEAQTEQAGEASATPGPPEGGDPPSDQPRTETVSQHG